LLLLFSLLRSKNWAKNQFSTARDRIIESDCKIMTWKIQAVKSESCSDPRDGGKHIQIDPRMLLHFFMDDYHTISLKKKWSNILGSIWKRTFHVFFRPTGTVQDWTLASGLCRGKSPIGLSFHIFVPRDGTTRVLLYEYSTKY
jgi:hypothetical protein